MKHVELFLWQMNRCKKIKKSSKFHAMWRRNQNNVVLNMITTSQAPQNTIWRYGHFGTLVGQIHRTGVRHWLNITFTISEMTQNWNIVYQTWSSNPLNSAIYKWSIHFIILISCKACMDACISQNSLSL